VGETWETSPDLYSIPQPPTLICLTLLPSSLNGFGNVFAATTYHLVGRLKTMYIDS